MFIYIITANIIMDRIDRNAMLAYITQHII